MEIRNIGLFAHVDAGKTTLTERMLHAAGAIREPGRVDAGTAHTDDLAIERARGISVRAVLAAMDYRGTRIQLIDTPGHADFTSEVERSLWALDGAVLLLSAVEGVQAQTEVLFDALRAQHIPLLLFINKIDRVGADVAATLRSVRRALTPDAVLLPEGDADEAMMEFLGERDEVMLDRFLAGERLPRARMLAELAPMVARREAFPVLTGCALRAQGVRQLLDAVVSLLPAPGGRAEGTLCGVVCRVTHGDLMGVAAQVRLFSGALKPRDVLPGAEGGEGAQRKVTQLCAISPGGKIAPVGELRAGEIGIVYGLTDCKVGEVLGDAALLPRHVRPGALREPLLMVSVTSDAPPQSHKLRDALLELAREDPLLRVQWSRETMEITAQVMGEIQLEVLAAQLSERFGLKAEFSPPRVIYKETIAREAAGFVAYTMPKPCWAVLNFALRPLPTGSGVVYTCTAPLNRVPVRYRRQVEQTIPIALRQGMLGWEVTDIEIELFDGEDHHIHTHPMDFIVATPMAIMDGLQRAGSVLLEPMLRARFTLPEECAPRLISDVLAMRGEVLGSEYAEGLLVLTARVPLATSLRYGAQLASYTAGRGVFVAQSDGYRPVDLSLGETCARRSVHPLDKSKYILAARSALEGGIFG